MANFFSDDGRLLVTFNRGVPINEDHSTEKMMAIVEAINRNRVVSFVGGNVKHTQQGKILSAKRGATATAGGGQEPWDVTVTPDGENYKIKVIPGVFGNAVMSNYDDEETITDAVHWVYLDITTSNGAVTACTWAQQTSIPTPSGTNAGTPPITFKYPIAIVDDGTVYKLVEGKSFFVSSVEAFRNEKGSPTAGELPYDIYYAWQVSQ